MATVRIQHLVKGDVGGTVCGVPMPSLKQSADYVELCSDCLAVVNDAPRVCPYVEHGLPDMS